MIKILKELSLFDTDVIIVFLFLFSSFMAVYWSSFYTIIFYFSLIVLAFYPLEVLQFLKSHLPRIFLFSFFGTIIYLLFSPAIKNVELWGDEIGVIKTAHLQFKEIVSYVSTHHASVPPLDYWNLWFWKFIADFTPIDYAELVYRIPYMFFHGLAAIIFSLLIEKTITKDNLLPKSISFIAFLTYFLNPILFFYSIEVRFYSLAALGSVITLYLFVENKLYQLKFLPLLLLFCLNSIFEFILFFPLLIYGLIKESSNRKSIIISLISLVLMLLVIWPKLLIPQPVSAQQSLALVLSAFKKLVGLQFWTLYQIVTILIIIAMSLILNQLRRPFLLMAGFIFSYLIFITFTGLYKGYFDFHARHYLFILPFFLYLLFPLSGLSLKQSLCLSILIFAIFTLPWANNIKEGLQEQSLFTKSLIGSKKIIKLAESKKLQIIVAPNIDNNLPEDVYRFNLESFFWYTQFYPSVKVISLDNFGEACRYFEQKNNSILLSVNGILKCPNDISYQEVHLFGSVLGFSFEQR
jgi:hypothetical protein